MAVYKRPGIYVSERLLTAPIAAVGTSTAAGAVAAPFASGPTTATLVSSWYEFSKIFGGYNASFPATFEVAAFFQNGGRELYVKRVIAADAVAAVVSVGRASGSGLTIDVTAKDKGADGNNLRVKLAAGSAGSGYYDFYVYREGVAGTGSDITNDVLLESYENVVTNNASSTDYIETVVNMVSQYVTVDVTDLVNAPNVTAVYPLTGGSNGSAVALSDYQEATNGVVAAFSTIDRPLVVFLPALDVIVGANNANTFYVDMIGWAANDGKHYVVAGTPADRTVTQALAVATALAGSSHGAVYYPHYFITDPVGRSSSSIRKVGPSGAVAGIYMNTDATTGPFKAPAGIGTTVQGAIALEKQFTSAELDSLNGASAPVNAIRQIPGAGISVMGARTLKQDGTANKYVNMRRSLIYVRKKMNDLTQFALFENNDEKLWERLNTVLVSFLNEYRNQGGLRGATPADSFYVKVDAENNPDNLIAQGEVHIEVGVALQYPAEFVVITLSQKTVN
jgi:phage tail sheath protein FI